MDSYDTKVLTTLRLESRLRRAAKQHSLSYSDCRLHRAGSFAWYLRQALIEKLVRDGFDPRAISPDCKIIYQVYTSRKR